MVCLECYHWQDDDSCRVNIGIVDKGDETCSCFLEKRQSCESELRKIARLSADKEYENSISWKSAEEIAALRKELHLLRGTNNTWTCQQCGHEHQLKGVNNEK